MKSHTAYRFTEIGWAVAAIAAISGFGWSLHELHAGFEARFDAIRPGTGKEEVLIAIGKPARILDALDIQTQPEKKLHEKFGIGFTWWIYDQATDSDGPILRFVVLFDGDNVVRTEKRSMARE